MRRIAIVYNWVHVGRRGMWAAEDFSFSALHHEYDVHLLLNLCVSIQFILAGTNVLILSWCIYLQWISLDMWYYWLERQDVRHNWSTPLWLKHSHCPACKPVHAPHPSSFHLWQWVSDKCYTWIGKGWSGIFGPILWFLPAQIILTNQIAACVYQNHIQNLLVQS